MQNDAQIVFNAIFRFLLFSAFIAGMFGIMYVDIAVFHDQVKEISLTEISQETFLGLIVAIFVYLAVSKPLQRGFYELVAGFYAALLIRELDALFDYVWHGFWVYPAVAVSLMAIALAHHYKGSVLNGFAEFCQSKAYIIMVCGLVTLLIFSRLFGMGDFWKLVLSDGYVRIAKNIAEEGTELLGYGFIFIASSKYLLAQIGWNIDVAQAQTQRLQNYTNLSKNNS
ncbi:hypothetical protein [Celerinatantimonas diazotrophica]|uniref:Uncharacterized protein n=1 Tax=Celerinatantimonas diazotrophica TaxID=412034 RepID=A0A4R1JM09_9GAMM|nr:hypothetical protein [Celerinatantimonas diazotrophica]TCK52083.1 hypothetical protein EV690_2186 [Celerinatantimonas diazotrophica]CAG9296212.1 hypothetical protein CEDIAZO_01359 [Celerinatantimonas diazotrophica]